MRTSGILGLGLAGIAVIVGLTIAFGSWYKIDETERGVILTNGAYTGIAEPGLRFKIPVFQSVVQISTERQSLRWAGPSVMEAYSRDQQGADLTVTVNWRIDPTKLQDAYSTYGANTINNISTSYVATIVPEALKEVFGRFSAEESIQERERLNREVSDAVILALSDGVIIPLSVQIEDIAFSDAYANAVEARMTAQVAVEQQRQILERNRVEAETRVVNADAEARATIAAATADATATRLRGEADADAIRARGTALQDNPRIVEYLLAERWTGVLPTQMIPGGTVPFLNLGTTIAP